MYQDLKAQLKIVGIVLVVIAGAQLLNTLTLGSLSQLGIHPRSITGLLGIPLAPLIHHGWFHLLSNLFPLAVLMMLVAQYGNKLLWLTTAGIVLLGGVGVWLFGGAGSHAGASGLVFGYWGFLLAYAWFERNLKSLLIATVVILFYGGMFFGFLYVRPHVSWSSHLFGALAGVLMAWWLTRRVGVNVERS